MGFKIKLGDFFNSCPTAVCINNSFTISWSEPGIGFGEFHFYEDGDGFHCDNEGMNREFVKKILTRLADEVILDG